MISAPTPMFGNVLGYSESCSQCRCKLTVGLNNAYQMYFNINDFELRTTVVENIRLSSVGFIVRACVSVAFETGC